MFPRNSGSLPDRRRELSQKEQVKEKDDDCSVTIYLLSEAGLNVSYIYNPHFSSASSGAKERRVSWKEIRK
jgi:ABC-type ATPase with predicted acetyltransferase domain